MRCAIGIAWVLLACSWPVAAAKVIVHLADAQGHAISDAVITLTADAGEAAVSIRPSVTNTIDQRDETFIPYVQIFRPGDKVAFRNSDTTRHQVYSFAATKTFEFVLRPGESSPALSLDKPGIVAVGCNIHDQMISYLFVSSAAAIAVSGSSGDAVIDHLATGHYTAHIWHPQLHPGQSEPGRPVVIDKDADTLQLDVKLSLMPDPRMSMGREHMDY